MEVLLCTIYLNVLLNYSIRIGEKKKELLFQYIDYFM